MNPFVPVSSFARAILLLCVLTVALVVSVGNITLHGFDRLEVAAAGITYVVVVSLPLLFFRRNWGWFHPLIVMTLWWAGFRDLLPTLPAIICGIEHHRALEDLSRSTLDATVAEGLLLKSFALLCVYAGYGCIRDVRTPKLAWRPAKHIPIKIAVIAAVSFFAVLMLINEAGGIGMLMLQRGLEASERVFAETGRHWHFLAGLLSIGCLVWLASDTLATRTLWFWVLFSIGLAFKFLAQGSRGAVLLIVIIAIAIWSMQRGRIPHGRLLVVAFFAAVFIGAAGDLRERSRGVDDPAALEIRTDLLAHAKQGLDAISSRGGEQSGYFALLGRYAGSGDLLLGESYLAIPAAPIPRLLWPSKPHAVDKLNAERIFQEPANAVSPGEVGEAFWNFHFPGVAIVFFIWGIALRWLSSFQVAHGNQTPLVVVIAITLFLLQPGSLAAYKWLQHVLPAMLFIVLFCGLPRGAKGERLVPRQVTSA